MTRFEAIRVIESLYGLHSAAVRCHNRRHSFDWWKRRRFA